MNGLPDDTPVWQLSWDAEPEATENPEGSVHGLMIVL